MVKRSTRPRPDPGSPPTTGKIKPRRPPGGTPARSSQRKKLEAALKEREDRLAADLDAMTKLHTVSTKLIREGDLGSLLEDILAAAIGIAGADFGTLQLLDPSSGALKLAAHRGFERPFLEFFAVVPDGVGASCGRAMERGGRVIVEDATKSPIFIGTEALEVLLAAGVRSVTSTPLIGRTGRLLGMLSTHRRVPHRPEERVLRLTDLLVRQAADALERVRAEEALREAEAAARREAAFRKTLEDSLLVGLAAVDLFGRQIYVNDAFCRMTGWGQEDLLGAFPPFRYIPPEEQPAAMADVADLLEEKPLLQIKEVRLLRRDGEHIDVLRHVSPVQEEPGRIQGYVASFINITERKEAEATLKKSEKRYSTLFNAIDEGFCIIEVLFDEQGEPVDYRFLEINPVFERHTGLVDAQGKRVRELIPKHDAHWFEIYGRIALTGEPARFENRAEQLGRWYDVYAFRVGRPEDRQVAVLFKDVTERKRAEEALKASETLFRTSVETMVDGFAIFSAVRDEGGTIVDFRYDYINEAGCRMNGRSREETLGRSYTGLFPGIKVSEWFQGFVRTVETGKPLTKEALFYTGVFAGGEPSSRAFDLSPHFSPRLSKAA
jgi:PAS domain S-box-containing protein